MSLRHPPNIQASSVSDQNRNWQATAYSERYSENKTPHDTMTSCQLRRLEEGASLESRHNQNSDTQQFSSHHIHFGRVRLRREGAHHQHQLPHCRHRSNGVPLRIPSTSHDGDMGRTTCNLSVGSSSLYEYKYRVYGIGFRVNPKP